MEQATPTLAAVGDDDVGVIGAFVGDRDTGLDLGEIVNLGALHAEADPAAEHQVVEEQLKVLDLLDVREVAIVKGGAVELLHQGSAQLPQRPAGQAGSKVKHVIEKRFGFVLGEVSTDLDGTVDAPLDCLWPGFTIS